MNQEVVEYIKRNLQAGHDLQNIKLKLLEVGHSQEAVNEAMSKAVGGQAEPPLPVESQESLGVFQKVGLALSDPNELFKKTRHEGVFPALKYEVSLLVLVWGIVYILAALVVSAIALGLLQFRIEWLDNITGLMVLISLVILFLLAVVILIFSIVFLFALSGLYHLIVLLLGGKGEYAETFKALVYGTTPSTLLFPIPLINNLAGIWSLVLMVLALSSYHSVSVLRALAVILIPPALVLALIMTMTLFTLVGIQ